MQMNNNYVVIDADFFIKCTEQEIGTGLFQKIVGKDDYIPVMHSYVAKVELSNNVKLRNLIKQGKIVILGESSYLNEDEADLEDYIEYFHEAYKRINNLDLGEQTDVLTYGYDGNASKQSLGEIRSLYMAFKLGILLFLSNDNGSKVVADCYINSSQNKVIVKNLYTILKEQKGYLKKNEVKPLIKSAFKNDEKRREELYSEYQNL